MKSSQFYIDSKERAKKPYHYTDCGLDNIFLLNGFEVEQYDGEEYVSITNIDGLWKAIGLQICLNEKTLSPKEAKFLRKQMGKTQAELAAQLRISDQTVARWEKAECSIDGPADLALRVLFLLSPVAQPEGLKFAEGLVEIIKEIVAQDEPDDREMTFIQTNNHWDARPLEMA